MEPEIVEINKVNEIAPIEKKEIKEVQQTIVPKTITIIENLRASEEEFMNVLKVLSPGTNFRSGLDGILRAKKGALLVVENDFVLPLIDGGFKINCRLTPQKLVELSKMDGAIVLSHDLKRINYANVLLTPDSKIRTAETGTKHKAAERTAKQTGSIVVAVSERKNEVNIFYKNIKYHLKETDELLRKVNEHIQILEKQRELFENHVGKLNKLEIKNNSSLFHAVNVIQKGMMIQKIANDIKRNIMELGTEGVLLKTRFKEILSDVERETHLVAKDYTSLNLKRSKALLDVMTYDDILDKENILSVLGHSEYRKMPLKGWRILSKTFLHEDEVAQILKEIKEFEKIQSNKDEVARLLGNERARLFYEEIERLKLFLGSQ